MNNETLRRVLFAVYLMLSVMQSRVVYGQTNLKTRYEELSKEINTYNRMYYVDGNFDISDGEYDALLEELIAIERSHPEWRKNDSATQQVGSDLKEGDQAFRHRAPMLSIKSIRDVQGLIDFDKRIKSKLGESVSYYVEHKVDGVAISLQYEKGKLIRGLTRGNGKKGKDVTAHVNLISSIPKKLQGGYPEFLEVRGEIYIPKVKFGIINDERKKSGKKVFANARNLAAGTLNLKDMHEVLQRGLEMTAFGIGSDRELFDNNFSEIAAPGQAPAPSIAPTQDALLGRLALFGFKVNSIGKIYPVGGIYKTMDAVIADLDALKSTSKTLPFETDGIVIKVNNLNDQIALGSTQKNVRGMLAFKFYATQTRTIVRDITSQVGRTGRITPVALLKPVWLDGSRVSRATLHNADELTRLNVHVGDTVMIEKAGRVIPQIINIIEHTDNTEEMKSSILHACPVCFVPIKGMHYRCKNDSCPGRIKKQIEYFADKTRMNIKGLGPVMIGELVEAQLVKNQADLYQLDLSALRSLDNYNEKKARALLLSIENSKNQPFPEFLSALGIRLLGPQKADTLAGHFKRMETLKSATVDEMKTIDGIGKKTAQEVFAYFRDKNNKRMLEILIPEFK